MRPAPLLLLVLVSGLPVRAQSPEAGWTTWPAAPQPGAAPAPPPAAGSAPPPAAPLDAPPVVEAPPPPAPGARPRPLRPLEPPNAVSLKGANPLGPWVRGELASIGFPVISLRFLVGLGPTFDLGVGFDSFYLVMNEPRLVARLALGEAGGWTFGAALEAGYAFFATAAVREDHGARWLTGRRNINVTPALVASYQGSHPRSVRFFVRLEYLLALDLEPFVSSVLQGTPPPVVAGHNGLVAGGVEVPLSSRTSFLFSLGLQLHGRELDSRLMPEGSVGVVTSF